MKIRFRKNPKKFWLATSIIGMTCVGIGSGIGIGLAIHTQTTPSSKYKAYTSFYDGADAETDSYEHLSLDEVGNKYEYWIGGDKTKLLEGDINITNFTFDVTSSNPSGVKVLQINDDAVKNQWHILVLDTGSAKISANFYINGKKVAEISKKWNVDDNDLDNTSWGMGPNIFTIDTENPSWSSDYNYFHFDVNGGDVNTYLPINFNNLANLKTNISDSLTSNFNINITHNGNPQPPYGDWRNVFDLTQTIYPIGNSYYSKWHFKPIATDEHARYFQWTINIGVITKNGHTFKYNQFVISYY